MIIYVAKFLPLKGQGNCPSLCSFFTVKFTFSHVDEGKIVLFIILQS